MLRWRNEHKFQRHTFSWRASTGWWTSNSEEFFVKVQVNGKSYYINDSSGKKEIAKYIVFKDEFTKRTTEKSTNNLSVTVDENEIDLERYEPCRFKKITVTDEGKPIDLFDEGALKIDQDEKKEFAVSEKIFFEFDKWDVTPSAQGVLDGIATFLLDSPFVPVTLGAHCDARGDHAYNDPLSFRRAASSVAYLVSKGVSSTRIKSMGYGKRKPYIHGEDLSEEQHRLNRRVTVEFNISGGDAESIVFSAIAPDKTIKKELLLEVSDYKVQKCLRKDLNDAHDDKVYVIEQTREGKSEPKDYPFNRVNHEIFSDSTRYKLAPLDFILPHKVTPNKFLYYINSCRYYSDKEKATVVANVYPDIKWDFHVFGKLSNPLDATWQGLDTAGVEEMKEISGKIAAQTRWKQAETAFGAALNANWNKIGENKYDKSFAVGGQYENYFKKFYELFNSLKGISDLITSVTGGGVKKVTGEKFVVDIQIIQPNVCAGAEWLLDRASDNGRINSKIGTLIKPYFNAEPFIGVAATFDLLAMAVRAANPAAGEIFSRVRAWAARGYDSERFSLKFKMWIDAILTGSIDGSISGEGNTESTGDLKFEVELTSKIDIELTAGLELTAKLVIVKVGRQAEKKVNGVKKAKGIGIEGMGAASVSSGTIGIELGGKSLNLSKMMVCFSNQYYYCKSVPQRHWSL